MPCFSFGGLREPICDLLEPEIAAKVKPIWGLDGECELNSAWRDCGVENLWIMLGARLSRPVEGGRVVLMDLLFRGYLRLQITFAPSCIA